MTPVERQCAEALVECSFLPASWDKQFARGLGETARNLPTHPLSDSQRAHLFRLVYKYRRQIGARILDQAYEEMERAAAARVDRGLGALPDFRPRRERCPKLARSMRETKHASPTRDRRQLPLL